MIKFTDSRVRLPKVGDKIIYFMPDYNYILAKFIIVKEEPSADFYYYWAKVEVEEK